MFRIWFIGNKTLQPAVVEPASRFSVSDVLETQLLKIKARRKTPVEFQPYMSDTGKHAERMLQQNVEAVFRICEIRHAKRNIQNVVILNGGENLDDFVFCQKRQISSRIRTTSQ